MECKFFAMEHKLKIGFKVHKKSPIQTRLEINSKCLPGNISSKLMLRATSLAKHLKSISSLWKLEQWGIGRLKSILSHVQGFHQDFK